MKLMHTSGGSGKRSGNDGVDTIRNGGGGEGDMVDVQVSNDCGNAMMLEMIMLITIMVC